MENVKFLECKVKNDLQEYIFQISDKIAGLIRNYSNWPQESLDSVLSADFKFVYRVCLNNGEMISDETIKTIEKISNECDEKTFWNKLLADNGKYRFPTGYHELMEEEYGLKGDEEWWTAHFFMALADMIHDPEYD